MNALTFVILLDIFDPMASPFFLSFGCALEVSSVFRWRREKEVGMGGGLDYHVTLLFFLFSNKKLPNLRET